MSQNIAKIWRMQTDKKTCPHGLKSKDLLLRKGFKIQENLLTNRDEIDRFKKEKGVKTTPQIWINESHIGGYDALVEHFSLSASNDRLSRYFPIIAIFSMTALAACAIQLANNNLMSWNTVVYFVAISMVVLAIQKLQNLEAFSMQFITYDILAMKKIRYAYIYPFAEAYTGVGMLSGLSPWLFAPVGIFIGSVGGYSVIKAVYIEKKDLKCACVGGNSNVPLGFVSLVENILMLVVGLAMLLF